MKRVKFGDIIEIPTNKGLAYAQYTHRDAAFGALVRVLPGFHQERPTEFREIAAGQTRFATFFPLQGMVNKKIVTVVSNEPIPERDRPFPTFRAPMHDSSGKVSSWWLYDGEREWRIGELTAEQRKLPIRQTVNDTLLVDMIESGWTPETDRW
jgi:hypothetical protein